MTADLFIIQPIFIFMSANSYEKAFIEHAKSIGVNFFFEKPIHPRELKYLVKILAPLN